MYFNSISNQHNSLYHDSLFICGVSDTSQYPLTDFTRSANVWYRKANTWIGEAFGAWEFDDRNWSTLLSTTTDLTAGTQKYEIPENIRKIDRIEVMDNNGDYYPVKPFDKSQVKGVAMSEFYETDGFPKYYDLSGKWIELYPAPSADKVTTTAGLKQYFTRDISPFGVTDTVTEPGFDNHFHRIVSLGSAYDYCVVNGIDDRQKQIQGEIKDLKEEIKKFYGSRHKDMKPKIIPADQEQI